MLRTVGGYRATAVGGGGAVTSTTTVSIGDVETLPYDEEAYVTNSGTTTDVILNFGIPGGPPSTESIYDGGGTVFWYDQFTVLVGAALTQTDDSRLVYCTQINQSPGALGDSMQLSFSAPAGTYNIKIIGTRSASLGIVQWYVNDTSVGAPVDYYKMGQRAYTELYLNNIVIPTSGIQTLKHIVTGKNAASSGYKIWLCKFVIQKI